MNTGKFSGIYMASDLDGTLCCGTEICRENIEAIRYFTANGGLFSVCTGRKPSYVERLYDTVRPNTYVIGLNGGIITHPLTHAVLYRGYLRPGIERILDRIFTDRDYFDTMHVYWGDGSDSVFSPGEYIAARERFRRERIHKVVLIAATETQVHAAKQRLSAYNNREYSMVSSWPLSLEIFDRESDKGHAIRRVKERESVRLAIAVGDYENDIEMLRAADIGYAVENAPAEVRAAADRITASAEDGSIAQIVSELERDVLAAVSPSSARYI